MIAFCQQAEAAFPRLQEGGGGLNEQELSRLKDVFAQWIEECRELAGIGLPMALVHPDFRNDNLVKTGNDYRVTDWSDTVIAHPFLVLGRIYKDSRSTQGGGDVGSGVMDIPAELLARIEKAYLAEFAQLAEPLKLERGLALAESISPLWEIMRTLDRLEWVEPMTPNFYHLVVSMQSLAKEAIHRLD
jgi:aminoglycoside phosphotransferase (APT) family kinase protein